MEWNKVFEEADVLSGDLKDIADGIRAVQLSLKAKGVPVSDHRTRLWEWALHAHVASPLSPGMRILDVGCGKSPLLLWLNALGCGCFGVDEEFDAMFRTYGESLGVDFTQGTIYDLPFADGSLDFVCSTCVLEHIANLSIECPDRFLNEIARGIRETLRVLKPGGLSSHTVDFHIENFNEGWPVFKRSDLQRIVTKLGSDVELVGGGDWSVPDPLGYYLREDPVFNPDSPESRALKEALKFGIKATADCLHTCGSIVLRKR